MAKNKKDKGKGAAVVDSKNETEGKGAAVAPLTDVNRKAMFGAADVKGKEDFDGLPKVKPAAVAGLPEIKGFQIWKPPFKGIGAAFKEGALVPEGAAAFVVHCVNMARRFLVIPDNAGKAAKMAAEVSEGKAGK